MDLRSAELADRVHVQLTAVPFVLCQAVLGISQSQLLHETVTGYLGHNGSRGNGSAKGIAVNDGNGLNAFHMRMHGIHQRHLGTHPDLAQDLLHAFLGCVVNILLINIGNTDNIDQHGNRLFQNLRIQRFPFCFTELFAVVQPGDKHVLLQNDPRNDQRTSQGSPACFVHAHNILNAWQRHVFFFITQHVGKTQAFLLFLFPFFIVRCQQFLHAGPLVFFQFRQLLFRRISG